MEHLPSRTVGARDALPLGRKPATHRQIATSVPVTYIEVESGNRSDGFELWLQYWSLVVRRKFTLLVFIVGGMLAGLMVSVANRPLYSSSTTLEVEQSSQQQPFEGIAYLNSGDPTLLRTQVELLNSSLLKSRVDATLFDKRLDRTAASPTALTRMRSLIGLRSPVGVEAWRGAIAQARGSVSAAPVKDTRIVRISAVSTIPEAAADYANGLAAAFIEHSQEARWALYQNTSAWLERAQEELKGKLEESEKKARDYAVSSGLVIVSKDQNIGEAKLVNLQSELSRAQADRIAKQAVYQTAVSRPAQAFGGVVDGGPIGTYETQLADLRRQIADAAVSLTPENPKVQRLQAQVKELEEAQTRERANIVARLRTDYDAAVRREQQLLANFAQESRVLSDEDKKLIQYRILQREMDTYRALYETTLQRGKEASVAAALRPVSARVVDAARPSRLPYKPNLPLNMTLGLFGGLMVGVAFVLFRERADASIRAPGSAPADINVRELGVIPMASTRHHLSGAGGAASAASRGFLQRHRTMMLPQADADAVELATWKRKNSLLAESFRATLASILLSGEENRSPQIILVTSPSPREGKSTVVTNLAIALAEINRRVLLIDADFRRPRLHTIFGQANTWGLSDLLQEETPCSEYPLDALARETEIRGVRAIPSGAGGVAVSSLIHSGRMTELLNRLRGDFDSILIDTPPVLTVPDGRILARLADAVVLVIRAGQTTREAAATAASMLESDGVPLLGSVLNDWDPRVRGARHYSDYSEYYYRDALTE